VKRLASPLSREELNALPVVAPDLPEAMHFMDCPTCGQAIDCRNLGDVLHHNQPGHAPIPSAALAARLAFVEPMLPSLVDEPPAGEGWIHEIKYDGYRTQIVIDGDGARAFTRNGYDWSDKYASLLKMAGSLNCRRAIVDGEVIVQDETGRSDFAALRTAIGRTPERFVLMAFDLLHLDGTDLRKLAVEQRRERLEELVGDFDPGAPIHFSADVRGGGADFFRAVDAMGLEGIVSKKRGTRYASGRAKTWLKIKAWTEGEYLVIGTDPRRPR
jgi:bifunctional non-homologous end joining protein LigD